MKRIVRLTESDLTRIVRRVISEQGNPQAYDTKKYQQAVANWNNAASASGGVIKTGTNVQEGGKMFQATIYNFDMNFQCGPSGASFYPNTTPQNSEYKAYFQYSPAERKMFENAATQFCRTLWSA